MNEIISDFGIWISDLLAWDILIRIPQSAIRNSKSPLGDLVVDFGLLISDLSHWNMEYR